MCSSYATVQYISKYKNKNTLTTAYVIGEAGLKKELEFANIRVLSEKECEKTLADFLIVGLDRNFSYKKIEIAQKHILANKKFIATNNDSQYPSYNGIKPGAGSMVASVCFAGTSNSSSKLKSYDFIVGKPNTYMLKLLLGSKSAKNCVLVGDRLDSDIALAKKMNMYSILVLSGVTKKEHLKKSKIKPDVVLNSVKDLPDYLRMNSLLK
jgi:4-nitrophenyl phosphatase